jgi:hypothetical protein
MSQQIKKLFYNKNYIDSPDGTKIADWKIAPWKVFTFFITLAVAMILIYAFFFTKDTQNFLGSVLFYSILLILTVAAIWLIGSKAVSMKQRLTYFLIMFIVLWLSYWILSLLFDYTHLLKFYMGGYILWIILSVMAFMGAKLIIDIKQVERAHVLFVFLVLAVFIGANIPMTSTGTTDTYTLTHITAFNELSLPSHVSYGDIPSQHYAQVIFTNDNVTENVNIGYDTMSNGTTRTFTYSTSHSTGFLENVDGIISKILSVIKL